MMIVQRFVRNWRKRAALYKDAKTKSHIYIESEEMEKKIDAGYNLETLATDLMEERDENCRTKENY